MTDIGVRLIPTVLGSQGSLIPIGGDDYFKQLVAGVESSKYIGTEKVGDIMCHHLRFIEKRFDWDIWIDDGKRPVVEKVVVDMSKQSKDEKATVTYGVAFSDWDVAPKFKPADFTFKQPVGAEEVDVLIDENPPHPLLGKPAPEFKTTDLDEHPFDLKAQLGKKVILLDFWATWCGPCVEAMPKVDAVANKFTDRGLVFRAVNGGEDADTIKQFLEIAKLKVPVVLDTDNAIAQAYMVQGIPMTVLIGKDSKVHAVHEGYNEDLPNEISREIEALLAGKDLAGETLNKSKNGRKKRSEQAAPATETASRPEDKQEQ
jgi:thiol-disulfide isomerase/thioredoxin